MMMLTYVDSLFEDPPFIAQIIRHSKRILSIYWTIPFMNVSLWWRDAIDSGFFAFMLARFTKENPSFNIDYVMWTPEELDRDITLCCYQMSISIIGASTKFG